MNKQFEAAWEVHLFLTGRGIPYMVIGGLAVQYWGEPRFTRDVDITVAVPFEESEDFIRQVLENFTPRVADATDFARRTRMILIKATNGCEVDISLSVPGYEERALERAIEYELAEGKKIRLCSAEDLIIHKAVAGRPRDLQDIEGIVYRQGDRLDVDYIHSWLKEFAAALEEPDLSERFEVPWHRLQESLR
ncbi:MAG: nucleotidyl transferase AbiEii/AbiGii toxin family protein [Anaerolineae bacterium]